MFVGVFGVFDVKTHGGEKGEISERAVYVIHTAKDGKEGGISVPSIQVSLMKTNTDLEDSAPVLPGAVQRRPDGLHHLVVLLAVLCRW